MPLPDVRRHDERAAVQLDRPFAGVEDRPVRGQQPESHGRYTVDVPHSAQNTAPSLTCVPQLLQNRLVAVGAAARAVPQCWQNLPEASWLQAGQRAPPWSRQFTSLVQSTCWIFSFSWLTCATA